MREIRRRDGLIEFNRRRAIHANAAFAHHVGQIVQLFIGAPDEFFGPVAAHAFDAAFFGKVIFNRGFGDGNAPFVRDADDDVFERIPFIPRIDDDSILLLHIL